MKKGAGVEDNAMVGATGLGVADGKTGVNVWVGISGVNVCVGISGTCIGRDAIVDSGTCGVVHAAMNRAHAKRKGANSFISLSSFHPILSSKVTLRIFPDPYQGVLFSK